MRSLGCHGEHFAFDLFIAAFNKLLNELGPSGFVLPGLLVVDCSTISHCTKGICIRSLAPRMVQCAGAGAGILWSLNNQEQNTRWKNMQ